MRRAPALCREAGQHAGTTPFRIARRFRLTSGPLQATAQGLSLPAPIRCGEPDREAGTDSFPTAQPTRYPRRHEHTTRSQAGPPMTLGNMRANGVRSLDVSCWQCHHRAILSADPWPDHVPVPSFGPRMVCTRCGIIGADARPNWQEQPERETLTGVQWR